MEFIQQFKAARRVSTPLVAVQTFDAKSTIDGIRAGIDGKLGKDEESPTPFVLWDIVNGMKGITTLGRKHLSEVLSAASDASPEMTIPLDQALSFAAMFKSDAVIFIANAHLHYKEPAIIQAIWNLRDTFKAKGNMLVLLVQPGSMFPSELTNDILVLDEPLPTTDELRKVVSETYQYAKLDAPDDDVLQRAVDALIGLPAFPAEQATAMCLDIKAKELDFIELWARKRQIVSQTRGLKVWEGKETLADVGGLDGIKVFLKQLMEGKDAPRLILFLDEVEKAFAGTGTDSSGVKTELTGSMLSWTEDNEMDGILELGVPGAGKSNIVKAVGGTYNVPVIHFNIAEMQDSLVGNSGANLKKAQKVVDAISGGRVLMIATCNSVTSLPPELLSRFKLGTFFYDSPTSEERSAIWKVYRAKYDIAASDPTPKDEGWTGREIKECAYKAWRMNLTLAEASAYVVPVTKSSAETIDNLRRYASGKYLSASHAGTYEYHHAQDKPAPSVHPDSFLVVDGRKMRTDN